MGLLGGLNLYQYAPNPLGWIDPLGLSCGRNGKWTRKGWKHVYERHYRKPGGRWAHKSKFNVGNEQSLKKVIDKTIQKGTPQVQRNGNTAYLYDFGKVMGARTNRQTGVIEYQNKVTVVVNKHGEIVTAFPSSD